MMNKHSAKYISSNLANIGFIDRKIRMLFGASLIAAVFVVPAPLGWWTLTPLLAIPLVITAMIAWDPIYALTGKGTRNGNESDIYQRSWSSPNMGAFDRVLRAALGGGLIGMVLLSDAASNAAWMTFLAIPIVISALIAWDPLYALANINTFSSKDDVATVGPELDEQTLAQMYDFADYRNRHATSEQYSSRAA